MHKIHKFVIDDNLPITINHFQVIDNNLGMLFQLLFGEDNLRRNIFAQFIKLLHFSHHPFLAVLLSCFGLTILGY